MSHAVFLRMQVTFVVNVRCDLDGHILHDFQSVGFQSHPFYRIIGKQTHLVNAYLTQDLCAYSIVAFIGLVSEADVGVYGVHAFFLELVGFHFFHQSDATSFLNKVDNGTFAF